MATAAAAGGRLDIVAASAVAAGAEVHNTYGEHGNAELLRKYGFALPPGTNPFDAVTLDAGALLRGAAGVVGAREARRRARWLQAHRWRMHAASLCV